MNTCNIKKVKFAYNAKINDGSSQIVSLFATIVISYFSNKITKSKDIFKYTTDREIVVYCINELKILIEKLEEIDDDDFSDYDSDSDDEHDSYWDNPIFVKKAKDKLKKCVGIVRCGSSEKNANYKLSKIHTPFIKTLISFLESADEHLFLYS